MDHASGLQTKLGCNTVGQFPLYQAAMSLMEEVVKCLHYIIYSIAGCYVGIRTII